MTRKELIKKAESSGFYAYKHGNQGDPIVYITRFFLYNKGRAFLSTYGGHYGEILIVRIRDYGKTWAFELEELQKG